MTTKRSRVDQFVDVFLGELSQFGLHCSQAVATRHIEQKIADIAADKGVSRKNALAGLTDNVVRELARETAVEFANEAPGGDPGEMPRPTPSRRR